MKELEKKDYIEALAALRELEANNDPAYLSMLRRLCRQFNEIMLLEGIIADLEKIAKAEPEKMSKE